MEDKAALIDYYEHTVKPTVNEFFFRRDDVRRGRLAAIVLDHMRDYMAVGDRNGARETKRVKPKGSASLIFSKWNNWGQPTLLIRQTKKSRMRGSFSLLVVEL